MAICFATHLNSLAKIARKDEKRCWDCNAWVGRCTKGEINRIAGDSACELFEQKPKANSGEVVLSSMLKGVEH